MQIMATFTSEKTSPERAQNHGVQTNTLHDCSNLLVFLCLSTHPRDSCAGGFDRSSKRNGFTDYAPSGRNSPHDFARIHCFRDLAESIR